MEGMDLWLLTVTSDPAAKGLVKDLEIAGAGPVPCHFSLPPPLCSLPCVVSNVIFHAIGVVNTSDYIMYSIFFSG